MKVGDKFNRWTVIGLDESRVHGYTTFFHCVCECGTKRSVRKDQLTRGISKSCGCWKREVCSEQITRISTKHGMAIRGKRTRTYGVWVDMRKRCSNQKHANYKNYGARGIKVCKRWNNYALFLQDMGEAPDGMSIDRINNEGDYEPSNCRWATKKTQANNTRTNLYYRHEGEILTLKQLSEKIGIPYPRLYQRIFKLGWSFSKAIKV